MPRGDKTVKHGSANLKKTQRKIKLEPQKKMFYFGLKKPFEII